MIINYFFLLQRETVYFSQPDNVFVREYFSRLRLWKKAAKFDISPNYKCKKKDIHGIRFDIRFSLCSAGY